MIEKHGRISITGEVKTKGFADVAAKYRLLMSLATKAYETFDKLMDRTSKLNGLLAGQTIAIEKAAKATGGLIKRYDLLAAANRAVALGISLNEDKFAKLAKSAAIVAQKLGTDVNQAIGDLMLGLGRQSKMILDNLGVIVDANVAYEEYAEKIGKVASQLTDAEKKIGWQEHALRKLNEVAGNSTLQVDTMSSAWKGLKNSFSDALDTLTSGKGELAIVTKTFKALAGAVRNTALWIQGLHGTVGGGGPEAASRKLADVMEQFNLDRNASFAYVGPKKEMSDAEWAKKLGIKTGRGSRGTTKRGRGKGIDVSKFGPAFGGGGEIGGGMSDREQAAFKAKQNSLANQSDAEFQAMERQNQAVEKAGESQARYRREVEKSKIAMADFATGALADFTGGLWAAADAAIHGGMSAGEAMRAMVKATLMGIAQQATIQAIYSTALGFMRLAGWDPGSASLAFTAAAKFGAVAAIAGAGGLAMSPVAAKSADRKADNGRNRIGAGQRSFGSRRRDEEKTIVVNLHMGGRYDPAASIWAREQIEAQVAA